MKQHENANLKLTALEKESGSGDSMTQKVIDATTFWTGWYSYPSESRFEDLFEEFKKQLEREVG